MMKITKDSVTSGMIFMVFQCLGFAILNSTARYLSPVINEVQFSFAINFLSALFLLPVALKEGFSLQYFTRKIHIIRGSLCTLDQIPLFYAISIMPVAQVTAITLLYPIFACIAAVVFLKERIGIRRRISIGIGIIGAIIIINPSDDFHLFATMCAMLTAAIWAILDIIIKVTASGAEKHDPPETFSGIIVAMSCVAAVVALPFMPFFWQDIEWSQVKDMIFVILFGGAANAMSLMALYSAFASKADVSILSSMHFLCLIFSAIIAYFCFDELISSTTLIGSIIVMGSTIYIAYREHCLQKKTVK